MYRQEKVKVIAEYDGWELRGEPEFMPPFKVWIKHLQQGTKMILYISPSGKEYDDWAKEMKYVTSMDWLHPVAIKVLTHLVSEFNISTKFDTYVCASDHIGRIKKSMYKTTINGEYTDLFNAVHDGIVFLNSNK